MLDAPVPYRFYLGMGVFLSFLVTSFISIFWFVFRVKRSAKDEINRHHHTDESAILNLAIREWYYEKIRAFEEYFILHKVTPNQLTLFGFFISLAAGFLFHLGLIGAAGWMVLASGTFDIFDGVVARRTNQSTKYGSYFDSVLDRYAEMIVWGGILSYYLQNQSGFSGVMIWVVFAAMVGAQMVSYTRAKSENSGVFAKVGIMQRPERFVYLGFGALFSSQLNAGLSPWISQRQWIFAGVVIFISLMSNLTAIRRLQYTLAALKGV